MSETRTTDNNLMAGYEAVRNGGVGLIDLSARGRISVSGSEAVTFLNGLITNDMKTLAENESMPAAFANVQGRLLASVRVTRRAHDFLLDTEAVTREKVIKLIERFTLAGDFKVADLTTDSALISIQGRGASALLEQITLPDDTMVIPATHTGEDGFDLIISAAEKDRLWQMLVAAGATPVSAEVEEILRIEAGIARYGVDMDETNVVTETNLDDAVSYTKGCYLGQEIIVRIKHRGHVAKKLTGLRFETDQTIEAGAVITSSDDKAIGRVTSATFSPRLQTTIALGYVRHEQLTPETPIIVNGVAGTVQSLPLVRGSWHET
jgi:folate-binding protein YgfZ